MKSQSITIANTTIHQDVHGRFSLNDLHKAAGNEPRHRPSRWLDNPQTKALIEEISSAGIPALVSINGGGARGTYGCREMVYAYATWISAVFFLKVIRAYDAHVTGVLSDLEPHELMVPLTEHLAQAELVGALHDEVADLKDEVLSCYRDKSPVRKVKEKIVYKVPVKAVELMLRYGIPNNLITEACGRDGGHVRVIKCNARKAGRLQ